MEARPRLIRVEAMSPCILRTFLIPCRQSCAEGSTRGPPGRPSRPRARRLHQGLELQRPPRTNAREMESRGAAHPRENHPELWGLALKTGKNKQGGAHLCGDCGGPRGPVGAILWASPELPVLGPPKPHPGWDREPG